MIIPVFLPQLPTTDQVVPYLREVENSRHYSNFGPLVTKLHSVLATYFGVDINQVITCSNATLALEGAIQTSVDREEEWISPSWTYSATNLALERCQINYFFGDINEQWRLIPTAQNGPIVDVCAFGDNLNLERFDNAKRSILVDAAASFPALEGCGSTLEALHSPIGVVISFHPTKVLPGVEGGVFLSNRTDWVDQVRQWSRFGMRSGTRITEDIGTNAKMSEYQAAVILASIANFTVLKHKWKQQHDMALEVSSSLGLKTHPAMERNQISSYWIIESEPESIDMISKVSRDFGFQTIRWWEFGCHKMPYFKRRILDSLPETERVARSTIGLPFHTYMREEDFVLIHRALSKIIN